MIPTTSENVNVSFESEISNTITGSNHTSQQVSNSPIPLTVETTSTADNAVIPKYAMQRWVKNVKDLWHEYSVGFKVGSVQYSSIQELDSKYKNGWKSETGIS